METLYLDCAAGISGDMLIGALLDLGLDYELWERRLALLGIDGEYRLDMERIVKYGRAGVNFDVVVRGKWAKDAALKRRFFDVAGLVCESGLSGREKRRSLKVLEALGNAQARAHGIALEQVAFHEPGAVDTIVDVVGACIAVEMLGAGRIVCSPVHVGYGSVCHRGRRYSVPAPTTALLLEDVPTYREAAGELTTPTGAALLRGLAQEFGACPDFSFCREGMGFGKKEFGLLRGFRAVMGRERVAR
ncbi:MAG: LarC family nickel insertion protein [Christensenellales bacterium]